VRLRVRVGQWAGDCGEGLGLRGRVGQNIVKPGRQWNCPPSPACNLRVVTKEGGEVLRGSGHVGRCSGHPGAIQGRTRLRREWATTMPGGWVHP